MMIHTCVYLKVSHARLNISLTTETLSHVMFGILYHMTLLFLFQPMHTEHNAWLNALDVIYHEALQRGSVKQFLTVLEGPQNEPKLMPASNKTIAITTDRYSTVSLAIETKPVK